MLIEFIEMLLGAYNNFIPDNYIHRQFFQSVIIVLGLAVAAIGSVAFGLVIVRAMFNTFNKRL